MMIKQLSGVVTDMGLNFIVLDVSGVGYLIHTNDPSLYKIETSARLHTHLAVRENSLDLYGFADRDTLEVFEMLITLPKIGPKSALQILTAADISLLQEAAANNDPSYLSKLSGIGKKSAEKIVSGLKEKFEDMNYGVGTTNELRSSATPAHTTDTIDALIALGYPAQDARRIVIEITSTDPSLSSSAEIVKLALQRIN